MKPQFSLYRRNGIYYAQDNHNGKQESLCAPVMKPPPKLCSIPRTKRSGNPS